MQGLVPAISSVLKTACDAFCQSDEILACESPIEADLIGAFKVQPCVEVLLGATKDEMIAKARTFAPCTKIIVTPQVVVGKFRTDFMMAVNMGGGFVRLRAVECDGYKYHRATASQFARDGARDRSLFDMGILTERYTGRQIKRDPYRCAKNEIEAICPGITERSKRMMGDDE